MKKLFQCVCCLFAVTSLLCFAQTPDSNDVMELLDAVPKVTLPCTVWNLLEDPDTNRAYSMDDFNKLDLMKAVDPDWWEHFKYIPIARFSMDEDFITILIHQYYDEEQYAILINYSHSGEFLDEQEFAYDNSEGWLYVSSIINDKNSIVVEISNIYENEGEPRYETYMIDENGHFTKKLD